MEVSSGKSDILNGVMDTNYQMLPSKNQKFPASAVKDILHTAINETLIGKMYDNDEAQNWCKAISNSTLSSVKELIPESYKVLVQVVIGQNIGAGVKIIARCLWDASTDDMVSQIFTNESVFCMASCYGIYRP